MVCVCGLDETGEGGGGAWNFSVRTKLPPTPQVPYIPLELELQQLFQELAGEVRRCGRAKWVPSSPLSCHKHLIFL